MTFAEVVDPAANARALALADAWEERRLGPAVPAYASTLLHFDPLAISAHEAARLARSLARAAPVVRPEGRLVEIGVRYDGEDLAEVARLSRLEVDELVRLHTGRDYSVYFLGFMPGFAYLGDLDPRIVAPRLAVPRTRLPAGSVAVAGRGTAIYPFASPGGWRILGTTGAVLFDAGRAPAALLGEGDRVRFVPE